MHVSIYPRQGKQIVNSRLPENKPTVEAICTMTSFDYSNQNPQGFCFLVQIRASVYFQKTTSLDNRIKYKKINETDSGSSGKMTPSCKRSVRTVYFRRGTEKPSAFNFLVLLKFHH